MDHLTTDRFATRALKCTPTIIIAVNSFELHVLVEALESRASLAADNPETIGVAGQWFDRAAALREAAR